MKVRVTFNEMMPFATLFNKMHSVLPWIFYITISQQWWKFIRGEQKSSVSTQD
jgi:hypothetical protein